MKYLMELQRRPATAFPACFFISKFEARAFKIRHSHNRSLQCRLNGCVNISRLFPIFSCAKGQHSSPTFTNAYDLLWPNATNSKLTNPHSLEFSNKCESSVVDPNRLCSDPDPDPGFHVHSDPDQAPDPNEYESGSYLNC